MAEVALVALAFAGCYLGFASLALTQKPHHMAVSASTARAALPASVRRRCMALGVAGLALGLASSLAAEGASFGSIVGLLVLGCAGLSVTFTLTYRPSWLRPLQRSVARARNEPRAPAR